MNKWNEYEKEKAKLMEMNLDQKEYEILIRQLLERLGL